MSEVEAEASSDPLKSVADAMEAAVDAAREGAADARQSIERALPEAGNLLAKFTYNACYTISYGVVFPTTSAARSVPQNNAVVHGLIDGARAAVDTVDEMKEKAGSTDHDAGQPNTGGGEAPPATS